MPRVSAAFFLSGALFLLAGVLLGGHMGKTNDYALLTVHTHLNLVGWVTMALFGAFYAVRSPPKPHFWPWIHFAITAGGAVLFLAGVTMSRLEAPEANYLAPLLAGEALLFISILAFTVAAGWEVFRPRRS